MNIYDAAALLHGREYRDEITREEARQFREVGLVAVFGASDDLMEFRGAIDDEVGAYDGTTAFVDAAGLLPTRDEIGDDEELKAFFVRQPHAVPVNALWCKEDGYSWTFATDIPHAGFDILEDGEPYCRGIVFALASADTRPEGGDATEIAAPFTGGAVPEGQTPKGGA